VAAALKIEDRRVWGSGFGMSSFEFGVGDAGFKVQGLGKLTTSDP
jgi:hypothetical protein